VGNPYCGWCKVLAQFLQDHEELFARDYIDLKIDTMRMTHGRSGGRIPPAEGRPGRSLVRHFRRSGGQCWPPPSDRTENIGYPYQPDEVAHFVKAIRETRKSITDTELAAIETDLHDFRIKTRAKRRPNGNRK